MALSTTQIQTQEETQFPAVEFDGCVAHIALAAGIGKQNEMKIFVFFEVYRGCAIHAKRNMNYLLVNLNGNVKCRKLWSCNLK